MEGNPESAAGDLGCGAAESRPPAPELRFEGSGDGKEGRPDPGASPLAGANGARYKSMSPARLPIARAPCLTIPPGFSPSALLESPVLLTNMKVRDLFTCSLYLSPLFLALLHRFFPAFIVRMSSIC